MQLDRSTREVELGLEYGTPTMNLTGQSLKFENGQWVAGSAVRGGWACRGHGWLMALRVVSLFPPEIGSFTGDRREMQRLRKRNQQLEEENNLLRLKVDILLDMVSTEPLSALRGGSADGGWGAPKEAVLTVESALHSCFTPLRKNMGERSDFICSLCKMRGRAWL